MDPERSWPPSGTDIEKGDQGSRGQPLFRDERARRRSLESRAVALGSAAGHQDHARGGPAGCQKLGDGDAVKARKPHVKQDDVWGEGGDRGQGRLAICRLPGDLQPRGLHNQPCDPTKDLAVVDDQDAAAMAPIPRDGLHLDRPPLEALTIQYDPYRTLVLFGAPIVPRGGSHTVRTMNATPERRRPGGPARRRGASASSRMGDPEQPRPRGRARNPDLDDAIATATRELLEQHGLGGLTIEAIARRAGVGKATVYRRWPNRDALLAHLLRALVREFPIPDRGHVRDDLIEFLQAQLTFLHTEAGSLYPALGAQAGIDTAARGALWELVLRRRSALLAVLLRGVERHQIRGDLDLGLAYYTIFGPVYYRYLGALAGHTPIEPNYITNLVDGVLLGIGTKTSTEPTGS